MGVASLKFLGDLISQDLSWLWFSVMVSICCKEKKLFDDDRELHFVGIKDENLECSSEFLLVQ